MAEERAHLSDRDLVDALHSELAAGAISAVNSHLSECRTCRDRMTRFQLAMTETEDVRRTELDARMPAIAASRALLRSRLAEQSRGAFDWLRGLRWWSQAWPRYSTGVLSAVLLAIAVLGLRSIAPINSGGNRSPVTVAPLPALTPGATVAVSRQDLCGEDSARRSAYIPASLQREVFREYGIANAPPDAYEVDYLITPELGGATNIRNLWPEPYYNTVWNAHVKDQLEQRLHAMVCSSEIDLSTAQREIATDWVSAYKKYFHTDRPLALFRDRLFGQLTQDGKLAHFVLRGLDDHVDPGAEYSDFQQYRHDLVEGRATPIIGEAEQRT